MRQSFPKPVITSPSNPKIKEALKLRASSGRRKAQRFLIDGWREIELAARCGIELETLFHSESGAAVRYAHLTKEPIFQEVAASVLSRISYGERGDSPVAVARTPALAANELQIAPDELVLVLDRTEKPGNLGACLRTASACGVSQVLLTDPICEVFNPNTIRASRGTVFTVPIRIVTANDFCSYAIERQLRVYCARVGGRKSLWECNLQGGCSIVLGNEAHGLDQSWESPEFSAFSIPMSGAADSLNLSISTAVTLYEAVRQRG